MSAMPSPTDLKTVLKLALPLGSRLLSGRSTTLVRSVAHLRARPPAQTGLDAHGLLLVSTDVLSGGSGPYSLESVIEKLAARPATALGVQGVVAPRTQEYARQHEFPLVALPNRAPLPQVERAVQRLLTDREAQMHARATELSQALQRHSASARGLSVILAELARVLDRPVVIHSGQGQVIAQGLPTPHGQSWDAHLALIGGADFIRRFDLEDRALQDGHWQVIESPAGITAPLLLEDQLLGYVSALTAGDRPDAFDLLALDYSSSVLVRELTRQQTIEVEAEPTRTTREWIADWLRSPATDDALIALRAAPQGFEIGQWHAVVLFQWVPPRDRAGSPFSTERMVRLLQTELRQRRINAPTGQYADRAVVLFPLDEPRQTQRLKQIVGLLHQALVGGVPDGDVTVGVGRPALGLTPLRDSFSEAERALALPARLWDSAPVAFFGDVSLYGLLTNVNDPPLLDQFARQWLTTLIEYDAQHHTDLLPTLSAYFNNNGNMARTAHDLAIHRNTLVYRLGRITEILQLDMDDSDVRLNLHLALKIHRLLHGE